MPVPGDSEGACQPGYDGLRPNGGKGTVPCRRRSSRWNLSLHTLCHGDSLSVRPSVRPSVTQSPSAWRPTPLATRRWRRSTVRRPERPLAAADPARAASRTPGPSACAALGTRMLPCFLFRCSSVRLLVTSPPAEHFPPSRTVSDLWIAGP
jgi:hypothetical protein